MNELIEVLEKKYRELEELISNLHQLHDKEIEDLCNRYVECKGIHIGGYLTRITTIEDGVVEIHCDGWERDYEVEFPLELFTDPSYIKSLEDKKAELERIKTEELQKLRDQEEYKDYLKLKAKYE